MQMVENLQMLVRFKRWANKRTFSVVMDLPPNEALKDRPTHFKNIVHTLNHVYVIDAIFRAHLEDHTHEYTARNTDTHPPIEKLWKLVQAMDDWYVNYCDRLTAQTLEEIVHFRFVDGGEGAMTRNDIILHIVNHATYHRGFVGDMLNQVPVKPIATDLPVYLREIKAR